MASKLGLTSATILVLTVAGFAGFVSKSKAGPAYNVSETATDFSSAKKGQGGGGGGGARRGGGGGGKVQRSVGRPHIQRNVGKVHVQRNVGRTHVQRNVGKAHVQRNVGKPGIQRDISKSSISQQRKLTDKSRFAQVKIRDAKRATIAGRNYSIWRGSHRVYRGGRWRTFVGLSTLGALAVGAAYFYPYAYIDAPAPYCEGLTEDGCQLRWREVPTVGGPPEFQCVAYCPWQ